MTGIDLNRAGTPLLEIVSEPDMRSSAEAVAYAKTLHSLVRWIGICDGNMQEGSFRCDANVSVRHQGSDKLGTRCEIKNLNSFRFLGKAIDYEARRQIEILEDGGSIRQETRLYDSDKDETRAMRSKEDAQDYRYFPDPDLLPLAISADWINRVRTALPELPEARRSRYVTEYDLSAYDAGVLTATREMADYFENTAKPLPAQAKLCANWIMGEVNGRLHKEALDITQCPVSPAQLAGLLLRIGDGTISANTAKEVFADMWRSEHGGTQHLSPSPFVNVSTFYAPVVSSNSADAIIQAKGLKQISDSSEIEKLIDDILAANPQQVTDYHNGKEKAFNSLVGQAMKATKGKANPAQVNEILKKKLAE